MSNYPEGFDSFDDPSRSTYRTWGQQALQDAIIAIQRALGLNPAGESESVADRLDNLVAGDSSHPDLAAHETMGLSTESDLAAHEAAADPHAGYVLPADLAGYATSSDVTDAVTEHEGASNPHSGYATDADLAAHAATSHGGGSLPTGKIVLWSGTIANIPSGWALCDGQNSTPDLRDRFIVGAGSGTQGTSGGTASPTAALATHSDHAAGSTGTEAATIQRGGNTAIATGTHSHTIPAQSHSAHAAYKWYALAYIIKT